MLRAPLDRLRQLLERGRSQSRRIAFRTVWPARHRAEPIIHWDIAGDNVPANDRSEIRSSNETRYFANWRLGDCNRETQYRLTTFYVLRGLSASGGGRSRRQDTRFTFGPIGATHSR